MLKGKVYSIANFSSTSSRNHDNDDWHKCLYMIDLPEFNGQLNIEEFLAWLVKVQRLQRMGATTKDAYLVKKISY